MKEIVLISPPSRTKSLRPPLGLMYISSILEKNGFSNDIIDIKSNKSHDQVKDLIVKKTKSLNPKIVGINCMTPDVLDVVELSKRIKKETGAVIIVGGVHATILPETLLSTEEIDYCISGEGEYTSVELAEFILNKKSSKRKKPKKDIRGIVYRNKDGKIIKNAARELIKNLDELPFPSYHKVNMRYYTKPNPQIIRGVPISGFYIFTSRGCPYRCRYCVNKNLFGRTIRTRSAKNVVDEIEYLVKRYKLDGMYIYDDTFAADINHAKAICSEIKKRRLKIIWGCETRANLITEELVKTLEKANCVQIDFGVESGSEFQLKQLRKDITIKQIKKAFDLCKRYNIRTLANFMINLPNETEKDIEDSKDLIRRIKPNITIINVTTPFPGTDLFEEYAQKLNLKDYAEMSSKSNFNEFIRFIEKKCKLSRHKLSIKRILNSIWKEFPSPQKLYFNLNWNYVNGIYRAVSFLFSYRYIKTLIRTKRKAEYLKVLLETLLKSNRSTNA